MKRKQNIQDEFEYYKVTQNKIIEKYIQFRKYLLDEYINFEKELVFCKENNISFDNKTILNVGAGECLRSTYIHKNFKPKKIINLDLTPYQIYITSRLYKKSNIKYIVGDCRNLPIQTNSIDYVIGFGILHHLPDFDKLITEINRVLKLGGGIVFFEPNKHNIIRKILLRHEVLSRNENAMYAHILSNSFKNKGFNVKVKYFTLGHNIPNNKYLSSGYYLFGNKLINCDFANIYKKHKFTTKDNLFLDTFDDNIYNLATSQIETITKILEKNKLFSIIPISVIILTKNEEKNIEFCLKSLSNFHQILILDSYSTDRTIEIAKDFDVSVYKRKFINYGDQRNYALNKLPIKNQWILFVDADEMITPELEIEIRKVVSRKNNYNGYYVNRKIFFNNKYLNHSGAFPNWNIRLFRKNASVVYKDEVNEHPYFSRPNIGYIKNGFFLHKNRNSAERFEKKHRQYAKLEAKRIKKQNINKRTKFLQLFSIDPILKKQAFREHVFCYIPYIYIFYFIYLYIFKLGILDGYGGLLYCIQKAKFFKLIKNYSQT